MNKTVLFKPFAAVSLSSAFIFNPLVLARPGLRGDASAAFAELDRRLEQERPVSRPRPSSNPPESESPSRIPVEPSDPKPQALDGPQADKSTLDPANESTLQFIDEGQRTPIADESEPTRPSQEPTPRAATLDPKLPADPARSAARSDSMGIHKTVPPESVAPEIPEVTSPNVEPDVESRQVEPAPSKTPTIDASTLTRWPANGRDEDNAAKSFDKPMPLGRADNNLLTQAILERTNQARARHGLGPLVGNATLNNAALLHARRMVAGNFFDHYDPEFLHLRSPTDRARLVGAANPRIAENIITEMAMEYESGESVYPIDRSAALFSRTPGGAPLPRHSYGSLAASVVDRWMKSPGHRANILAKGALQMGVGSAYHVSNGFPTFVVAQEFQLFEPIRTR